MPVLVMKTLSKSVSTKLRSLDTLYHGALRFILNCDVSTVIVLCIIELVSRHYQHADVSITCLSINTF